MLCYLGKLPVLSDIAFIAWLLADAKGIRIGYSPPAAANSDRFRNRFYFSSD